MIRTALLLGTLSLAGCGTITDFRSGLGNTFSRPPTATPAVAPAPVRPAAPVLTAKERLVVAIEGQGCELNATNVGAVLSNATITRDELLDLTPQLQSEGRVVVSGSGAIRVTSPKCI
tara:strand:- start:1780 stop:2133 length:354 start_codon:yes stop_codon:yes gene_type:complete